MSTKTPRFLLLLLDKSREDDEKASKVLLNLSDISSAHFTNDGNYGKPRNVIVIKMKNPGQPEILLHGYTMEELVQEIRSAGDGQN